MKWISYLIIFIMVIIFLSPYNFYDTSIEPVDYILRSTYHSNIEHLAINLFSLYNLSFIEEVIGGGPFLVAIIFIWLFSSILLYFYHKLVPSRKAYTVGFSGVIFGLVVIYYFLMDMEQTEMITHLLLAIVPQLFISGISIEGHISGIVSGFVFVGLYNLVGGKI